MRYILNDNGYIQAVSFNNILECQNKTCTEYTGTVPTGYETLAEWNENANINAYKIVNGNLTYDSEEDARLQSLWASQQNSVLNNVDVFNAESDSTTDTYSCDYINKLNSYSTEEQIVGTWLGKPLYRKVYTQTILTRDISNLNYDTLMIKYAGLNTSGYTMIPYYTNENDHFKILVNNMKTLEVVTSHTVIDNIIIVLEYTKTTD